MAIATATHGSFDGFLVAGRRYAKSYLECLSEFLVSTEAIVSVFIAITPGIIKKGVFKLRMHEYTCIPYSRKFLR